MAASDTHVSLEQVNGIFENAVRSLDQDRAADLEELAVLQSAKFQALSRDRARLVAKLGPDHPRIQRLDEDVAEHGRFLPVLASEAAAASATPPTVDAHSWALHGIVVDRNRKPLAGVTLALYRQDAWERRFGYTTTDERGRFQFTAKEIEKAEGLTLRVLRDSKAIFTDLPPVTIAGGRLEYREVALVDKSEGTPPEPSPGPTTPQEKR